MEQSTVFVTNKSQAIRLPKPVALPNKIRKVEIVKLGNSRLISPLRQTWDSWFDGIGVSDDFMQERHQPKDQERASL